MVVVDTNVLVYAADGDAEGHGPSRELVDRLRRGREPWYLTWGIVYEFLRVVTHPRVLVRPWSPAEAWTFLDALFASPSLRMLAETDRHPHVAAEIFRTVPGCAGNHVFDAHVAILMRENGLRAIYTCDTDFNRFPFLETIDPVSGVRRS
jgi:hypothetical protein